MREFISSKNNNTVLGIGKECVGADMWNVWTQCCMYIMSW